MSAPTGLLSFIWLMSLLWGTLCCTVPLRFSYLVVSTIVARLHNGSSAHLRVFTASMDPNESPPSTSSARTPAEGFCSDSVTVSTNATAAIAVHASTVQRIRTSFAFPPPSQSLFSLSQYSGGHTSTGQAGFYGSGESCSASLEPESNRQTTTQQRRMALLASKPIGTRCRTRRITATTV